MVELRHFRVVNVAFLCFAVSILLASLMPFVPAPFAPLSLLFIIFYTVFSLCAISIILLEHNFTLSSTDLYLFGFLVSLIISILPAVLNGVGFGDWFRGLVPFLFYVSFWLLKVFKTENFLKLMHSLVLVGSFLWLVKIVMLTHRHIPSVLSGQLDRLTYMTMDLTIPLGIIGFALSLFHPRASSITKAICGGLFLFIIVLSGYRSMLIIALMILLFFFWTRTGIVRFAMPVVIMLLLLTGFALTEESGFYDKLVNRFALLTEEMESVRGQEIYFAFKSFGESPVIGKGLSFPVPIIETRDEKLIKNFESDSVRYLHNVIAYFLMDIGIVGTLLFILFWISIARLCLRNQVGDNIVRSSFVAMSSVGLFFLVSASFRQIQTTLFIVTLAYIVYQKARLLDTN